MYAHLLNHLANYAKNIQFSFIGMAERALECMVRRVSTRTTFGSSTSTKGTILKDIADSRIEIQQCRLLTLQAASMMDTVGKKAARQLIAMIKVAAPAMTLRVIDRAVRLQFF